MAMILTVALTQGFQDAIGQKVYAFSGHIRVQHYEPEREDIADESPIAASDSLLAQLKEDPDVVTVQPYATKNALIKGKSSFEGLQLKGITGQYDFHHLQPFLTDGRWMQFPDSGYSSEVNLSTYTANALKLKTGDRVFAYFIQTDGSRRVRPLTVAGLFKTGIENFDRVNALVDLRLIQRLNNWRPNEIGGYELFVRDFNTADSVSNRIFYGLPQGWNSVSVAAIYGSLFDWLNLQNITVTIIIIIMILVATLNLITCLIILLLERTHMIGLLKALGSPNSTIQRIFLYHGGYIAVGGLILGNLLGLSLCWGQQHFGFITLPEDTYFISTAAVKISALQVLGISAGTFLVCLAVLLIPSFLIIRRMQPVKAMAFD